MTTEPTRLHQEAAALGLTGEASAGAPAPPRPRVGRTDKMLLAGACFALAAMSAAASIWLVVPVLVLSGLLATMLVHVLNETARGNAAGGSMLKNEFDPAALHRRLVDEADAESVEITTEPINRIFSVNLWHGFSR